MTSVSSVIDVDLRPFPGRIIMNGTSTIEDFYEAVTAFISLENEANVWEEFVVNRIPTLFENEADFKNHGQEIKRAIILGIRDTFDFKDGSDLVMAHELLDMSILEAARFKNLSANFFVSIHSSNFCCIRRYYSFYI